MSDNTFELVEEALRTGGSQAGFDFLARRFREEKNYPLLFEARLMNNRHKLGLPLIYSEPAGDLSDDVRSVYEQGFTEAAREAGGLFLADGDIPRAWSYFRAVGESAPVAAAIEKLEATEGMEAIIEIAFHERVNPRKGFELILSNYGVCRAITTFQQYPSREGRQECLRVLVERLYGELVESLRHSITRREGSTPETRAVAGLIAGRDWLFEDNCYYVDTTHVVSVLQFSLESTDRETLGRAWELAEYGQRLAPMFHYRGEPPFQNIFADHAAYLRVLLGEDVEASLAHFRQKLAESDPNQAGEAPAQVLVGLLARLGRHEEAIEVSLAHLRDLNPSQLACPSAVQLCQQAGHFTRLKELAREQGDLLSFAAAALQME